MAQVPPLVKKHSVISGFANGNLARLDIETGDLIWEQTIAIARGAFAIQRMIDIDANPIAFQNQLYAATYQGNIASIDWYTGREIWSHDISSYTGMVADDQSVFITDAKGHVWSFAARNGMVNWRQRQLEARVLSAPASQGRFIVVGDAQGYLHWLDKIDGHLAARTQLGNAIYASPISENGVIYALSNTGHLAAYKIR